MLETLQGTTWIMAAAFGSGLLFAFAALVKWSDGGFGAAFAPLVIAVALLGVGFSTIAKSDELTRDWFDEKNNPTPYEMPIDQGASAVGPYTWTA